MKKNRIFSVSQKRSLIDFNHPQLSLTRQCDLLCLPRSSLYYHPAPEDEENAWLMNLIDEQFLKTPFYGRRRMTHVLRQKRMEVNEKRIGRLIKIMGLEAIYPKPNLSHPEKWSVKYPYPLRGLLIKKPDQVWAATITYIRLCRGFVYLVAMIDWYSRYVLSWLLSTSRDADFCVEALNAALVKKQPEFFNSDQGSQFTSSDFLETVKGAGVKIKLDGRGRVFDNIMIERLWRSLKK